MPQMAPMWWMTLMNMFILSLMLCMTIVYFNSNKYLNKKMKSKKYDINWMW